MTHNESEEFSKHNDDVEIVVGKTGVRPCEREKRGQKGKRCVGTRMLVTLAARLHKISGDPSTHLNSNKAILKVPYAQ